jgi:hypothetical protein
MQDEGPGSVFGPFVICERLLQSRRREASQAGLPQRTPPAHPPRRTYRARMRKLSLAGSLACAVALFASACGSESNDGFQTRPNNSSDSNGGNGDLSDNDGAGFSRDSACAGSIEPTNRLPGALLIVLDKSFSMRENRNGQEPRFGEESRWEVATKAIGTLLDALPDDGLRLGLLTYPSRGCDVASAPQVPLTNVPTARSMIRSTLNAGPVGDTPTEKALEVGYASLLGASDVGARAMLLITDGAPNCGSSSGGIERKVSEAFANHSARTFIVGIPGSPSDTFSKLAVRGGTRRSATCNESCGGNNCCHYYTGNSDFKQALADALADIAGKIRTDCVYRVPRPAGKAFDKNRVNVLVSGVDGKDDQVLVRVEDKSEEGWSYTDDSATNLEIHGELCQKILAQKDSKVEVVVGCPTQVK